MLTFKLTEDFLSLIRLFYRRGSLTPPNYIKYIRHDTLGTEYLNSSLDFATSAKTYYSSLAGRLQMYGEIQKM
jgi:hypothetical protein